MSMTVQYTDPIRREARRSGLGDRGQVSMREVERRRLELWGIVLAMLTAGCAGVVVLSAWPRPAGSTSILSAPVLRAAMVLLAVGFAAYVMEKEIHLRKLSGLITDERVTIEALTRRTPGGAGHERGPPPPHRGGHGADDRRAGHRRHARRGTHDRPDP